MTTQYNNFKEAANNADKFFYLWDPIQDFYSSTNYKNMDMGCQYARTAEFDWVTYHALKMVPKDNGLFVYGDAKFNTKTNMMSLHGLGPGQLVP